MKVTKALFSGLLTVLALLLMNSSLPDRAWSRRNAGIAENRIQLVMGDRDRDRDNGRDYRDGDRRYRDREYWDRDDRDRWREERPDNSDRYGRYGDRDRDRDHDRDRDNRDRDHDRDRD